MKLPVYHLNLTKTFIKPNKNLNQFFSVQKFLAERTEKTCRGDRTGDAVGAIAPLAFTSLIYLELIKIAPPSLLLFDSSNIAAPPVFHTFRCPC